MISTTEKALLEAASAGDLDGIKRALEQGADVNAKDERSKTALHHLIGNGQLDLARRKEIARFLIGQGADLHARDYSDATPLRALEQEDADEIEETFTRSGRVMESDYRVLAEGSVANAAQLDKIQGVDKIARLRQGIPLADGFPEGVTAAMRSDYSGYKGDTQLCDLHMAHGVPVVSRKLRSFLEKQDIGQVEFLPLTIVDHSGNPASDGYFILNPMSFECLDEGRSEPRFSSSGTVIRQVKRLVIDGGRVPAGQRLFRIAKYRDPLIFERELAVAVEGGRFSNIAFTQPRR